MPDEPEGHRHARRADRQQRDAVRPGLQRRPEPASSAAATWTEVATPAGTWTPPYAETEFQQAFTANPSTNALLTPNDENAAPIITYLQTQGVKPNTFPITGQDATLVGLQNIISGYQCGTVYKPIFLEAQAAAALALYLRAGMTPPKASINGTTDGHRRQQRRGPVRSSRRRSGSRRDDGEDGRRRRVRAGVSQICTGTFAADCRKYGHPLIEVRTGYRARVRPD